MNRYGDVCVCQQCGQQVDIADADQITHKPTGEMVYLHRGGCPRDLEWVTP